MANLSYWNGGVGINHGPAYQVSGKPFVAGSVDCKNATAVTFPAVTRWVKIINKTPHPLRVGFSEKGVSGSLGTDVEGPSTPYFTIAASGSMGSGLIGKYGESDVLELKVSEVWIWGGDVALDMSAGVDIVAGLTSIPSNRTNMDPSSATNVKPNWSGSAGVG
tara:strand:- start:504 stop:992 length:489 start_codon:yes stop_codon:yes gene_type:complete